MKIKFLRHRLNILLIILAASILILIGQLFNIQTKADVVSTNPSGQAVSANQSIQDYLTKIDPNYAKNAGTLPISKFYFAKIWKESVIGRFKSGDKKTAYLLDLGQKRLVETYLVLEKGNTAAAQKSLASDAKIMSQIQKRDFKNSQSDLVRQYAMLNSLIKLTDNQTVAKMLKQSLNQITPMLQIVAQQNVQTQDWVEGKVAEKSQNSIIIDWQGQRIRFIGMDKAQFLDKNQKETKQTLSDIVVGAVVAVAPLGSRLNMQTQPDKTRAGIATADKIIIGGR